MPQGGRIRIDVQSGLHTHTIAHDSKGVKFPVKQPRMTKLSYREPKQAPTMILVSKIIFIKMLSYVIALSIQDNDLIIEFSFFT